MNSAKRRNPVSWVPSVYFGMGLPYVALSLVAVLMFDDLGVSDEEIARWTSLLVLPWSLKPFISILMEIFGTKRQYIYLTEAITAVMFGVVAFSIQMPDPLFYTLIPFGIIALSGSTHDIAGDGVYMQELSTKEQGAYTGWQGAFYNLAKILTNGGLVYLAGYLSKSLDVRLSWMIIMGICATIMLSLSIYHFFILPKEEAKRPDRTFEENMGELVNMFVDFFKKPYIWLYLLFIFFYRLAEGLAMKVAPLFLKAEIDKGGLGLSNEDYGLIYGTAGTIAFILGSILAGYFISYRGLKKSIASLVCIFNIPFVVYLLLAIYQPSSLIWIATGIVFEYFSYGFGFVGLTLFMMQQIAPGKYQMTHYAFANSLMNLAVLVPGYFSGDLSTRLGYQSFFILVMVCTIPSILMVFFLPFVHKEGKEVEEKMND